MMTKQEYERLATYLSLHSPEEEAPAQMAEHRRVLELEAQVTRLEGMLTAIKIDATNALSLADMQTDNSARVMVLTEGVRVVLNVALKALGR